jgi:hypothetical protein
MLTGSQLDEHHRRASLNRAKAAALLAEAEIDYWMAVGCPRPKDGACDVSLFDLKPRRKAKGEAAGEAAPPK